MHPQKYQISVDHQKLGTRKKLLKSPKIMQNYLKNALKKLTKYLVFTHPKMAFYFWTKPFGACKITEKRQKKKTNEMNAKQPKKA
jgi:hypothetical protein